jgi:hypothetical protein
MISPHGHSEMAEAYEKVAEDPRLTPDHPRAGILDGEREVVMARWGLITLERLGIGLGLLRASSPAFTLNSFKISY